MAGNRVIKRFIHLVHQTSGLWANWDPPTLIDVGDYGTLDANGELIVEGNIYEDSFPEDLKLELNIDIRAHQPELGDLGQDYIVTSPGVRRREPYGDLAINPAIASASIKGTWTFQKGKQDVFIILYKPRQKFLPRLVQTKIQQAKILEGMMVVTNVLRCPAYLYYLSDKSRQDLTVAFFEEGKLLPGMVTGEFGTGWWTNHTCGMLHRAFTPSGNYGFTPLFSLVKVKKSSWFTRLLSGDVKRKSVDEGKSQLFDVSQDSRPLEECSEDAEYAPQSATGSCPSLSSQGHEPTWVSEQYQILLSTESKPLLDLTPYIFRVSDRYFAGGAFGDVHKCWYHHPSEPHEVQVAVKALRFTFANDANHDNLKMFRRELGIWRRLDHLNIVPLLGIAYGFGMEDVMSLVSLWMSNGTLQDFIVMHDDLDVVHRLQLLHDIANGLQYLHSFPIVHGDLNANNVLLDAGYTARLADFGYASVLGKIPEALTYLQRSTTRPGALRWTAPEQIAAEEAFVRTTKSDIYSFGCVGIQVLSGKQPWSEVQEDAAVVVRLARGYKPARPASRPVEDLHWNLVERCWSSTKKRPTAEALIVSIKQFLTSYPPTPPLREIMAVAGSPSILAGAIGSLTNDHPSVV